MDVLEAIHQRRSVRDFLDRPVPDPLVWQVIEAGTWAPSAGNMQAWEFVIVKDPGARRKLVDTTDAGITARGGVKTQEWLMQAPVIIIVCYDTKRMGARYGQKGRELMTKLDCMGCAQNMMLAATRLGLGTCCVVGFDPQALKEALPIPKEITPLLLIAMGYPAYQPQPPYRLPPEDVVRLVI
ncbi:MAG: nitroreductase family protein [Anaerolineae bacterium]